MRLATVTLILGLATLPAFGSELKLPEYLFGRWESDIAHCALEGPTGGEGLFVERHDNGDTLTIVDWETVAAICDVVQVNGVSPDLEILGNCAADGNVPEATTMQVHMGPGQLSLGFSYSSAREHAASPTEFQRCVAIGRAS